MTSIDQLDLPSSIKDTLTKVDDVPVSRHKRHQLSKGSSGSSDRLGNLTPQEYALACEQAAAHIFESRIAYGTAMDLLQEEHWLSLGDPVLDTALGGNGFMTRGITEIAGERWGCRNVAHIPVSAVMQCHSMLNTKRSSPPKVL
ncbi:hypothetical protein BGX34_008379 [Mortierella sp. NVP85]|nr:hypothetical protein BGX34_008379 [Mortierella sp. NVP85]